ncbi:hypothetical protein K466DRAFT_601461 [Polyporus arcularius HHB13444]|uniref:DUF6533 domain-containing protein n=1 Tax=Polyporus arcularius HHB13444 TaxID=1314778 RepID=A0A5C3P747_9APHY|nr:hypothetical protein K466DRAFT_601461 [Polyporus arcularius HHB13444]
MSSVAEAIADYESIVVNNYCVVAGSVFLLYEYVITVDREVNAFWFGAPTGASILFLSNRYLNVVVNVLNLIEFGHFSDEVNVHAMFTCVGTLISSCASFARGLAVLTFMIYLPWAVFSGLRAYALCRGVVLSALILLLALVPLFINAARFSFNLTGVNDPTWGCYSDDSTPAALTLKCMLQADIVIISRASLIVSDVLLVGLTWRALPQHTVSFASLCKTGVSLTTVLLRDGTFYFGILCILNILHLIFSLTSMFGFITGASNISTFTEVVTAVLVSRFLLNLQEANKVVCRGVSSEMDQLSTIAEGRTISFARFIGSIGESIGPGLPGSDTSSSATEDTDDTLKPESFELHPGTTYGQAL